MFRRSNFPKLRSPSKESHPDTPTSTTNGEATPLSPAPVPITPIQSQQPQNISWASSTGSGHSGPSVYDINPKYTTANSSYTHRRRKSSYIPGLNFGGRADDYAYQPRYQDWRADMPIQQAQDSGSGLGGDQKEHIGDFRRRKRGNITVCAAVLVVIVLILSGVWIFGGPLPLVNPNIGIDVGLGQTGLGLRDLLQDRASLAGLQSGWQNLNLSEWRVPYTVAEASRYATSFRISKWLHSIWSKVRFDLARGEPTQSAAEDDAVHFATVSTTSTSTSTMMEHIDTANLIWATPATVSKVTMRTPAQPKEAQELENRTPERKTVGPAVQRQATVEDVADNVSGATVVGPPVQATMADFATEGGVNIEKGRETEILRPEDNAGQMMQEDNDADFQSAYLEELYRKYAQSISPTPDSDQPVLANKR